MKSLVKPRPRTLKKAEKELHLKGAPKIAKGLGGYALRNSKGVKVKKT